MSKVVSIASTNRMNDFNRSLIMIEKRGTKIARSKDDISGVIALEFKYKNIK